MKQDKFIKRATELVNERKKMYLKALSRIAFIVWCRETFEWGLKEAKDFADAHPEFYEPQIPLPFRMKQQGIQVLTYRELLEGLKRIPEEDMNNLITLKIDGKEGTAELFVKSDRIEVTSFKEQDDV